MSKKKILILILAFIILSGVAIGAYFYVKSLSGVRNWNLYEDKFYGYSIKYPKEWFIYPDEIHKPGYSTDITSYDLNQYSGEQNTGWPTIEGELSIHIAVENMGDSKNLDDWIVKNPPPVGDVLSQDKRVVAGINSIVQTTSELGLQVLIPKNKQVFIIHVEPLDSLQKNHVETFDMMLRTFKFTK
jgi:hypothetical protein